LSVSKCKSKDIKALLECVIRIFSIPNFQKESKAREMEPCRLFEWIVLDYFETKNLKEQVAEILKLLKTKSVIPEQTKKKEQHSDDGYNNIFDQM
jgi:hypothetical protein